MTDQDDVQPVAQEEEALRLREQTRRLIADADASEAHARAVAKNPSVAKLDPPEKHLALAEGLRRTAKERSDFADDLEKRHND